MPFSDYRRLRVYRHAAALSDDLTHCAGRWSAFHKWSVGIQTVRAADSIGANIAESCGRWGRADQQRFLFFARGSAYELEHWIERAYERDLPLPENCEQRVTELIRMLNAFIRAARRAH